MSATRAPSGHRLCRHLRFKEMYYEVARGPGEKEPAIADEPCYSWCLKTFRDVGPEGEPCGVEECSPARACYEA